MRLFSFSFLKIPDMKVPPHETNYTVKLLTQICDYFLITHTHTHTGQGLKSEGANTTRGPEKLHLTSAEVKNLHATCLHVFCKAVIFAGLQNLHIKGKSGPRNKQETICRAHLRFGKKNEGYIVWLDCAKRDRVAFLCTYLQLWKLRNFSLTTVDLQQFTRLQTHNDNKLKRTWTLASVWWYFLIILWNVWHGWKISPREKKQNKTKKNHVKSRTLI